MNNSGGALLTEVYGADSIKVKKKNKKKRELRYLPENKEYLYPDQLSKIDHFDKSFHENSNIMPYGDQGNYSNININNDVEEHERYAQYKHTSERSPKPVQEEKNEPTPQREERVTPPTEKKNIPDKIYEEPPKQWVWDKGVQIPQQEYKEFQQFKQFKAEQHAKIINQQRKKSQESPGEGFANINDEFNDVLLFGLLGIFFLIFTDYVYNLGRKSY